MALVGAGTTPNSALCASPSTRHQHPAPGTRHCTLLDKYLRLTIDRLIQPDRPPSFEVRIGRRNRQNRRQRASVVNADARVLRKIRLDLDAQIVEFAGIDGEEKQFALRFAAIVDEMAHADR